MWHGGAVPPAAAVLPLSELQPQSGVPAVLAMHDRQVFVENAVAPPTGYVLARRWLRNEPDVDVEHFSAQTALPARPPPAPMPPVEEPPAFPDDSHDYNPVETVVALKQHWVAVRRHDLIQQRAALARSRERLRPLLGASTSSAAVSAAHLLGGQQQAAAAASAAATLAQQPAQQRPESDVLRQALQQAAAAAAAAATAAQAAAEVATAQAVPTAAAQVEGSPQQAPHVEPQDQPMSAAQVLQPLQQQEEQKPQK